MVRVLVVADELAPGLHVQAVREIAPDLVLAAGDLPWDYLEYFASCVDSPVVFVPGNHDEPLGRGAGRHSTYDDADVYRDAPRPVGCTNADQRVVKAAGLTIAGLGGCVRYSRGPHQHTQREFQVRARRLLRRARGAGPVDVLLTHAPPFGLGDGEDRPHVGIEALHGVLEKLEPTWHLHGHIHPYGQQMPDRSVGRTTLRNVIPYRVLEIEPRATGDSGPTRHGLLSSW
jgi:Icc-related predicted phosphoesterase